VQMYATPTADAAPDLYINMCLQTSTHRSTCICLHTYPYVLPADLRRVEHEEGGQVLPLDLRAVLWVLSEYSKGTLGVLPVPGVLQQ
jgi:hypothetical protein